MPPFLRLHTHSSADWCFWLELPVSWWTTVPTTLQNWNPSILSSITNWQIDQFRVKAWDASLALPPRLGGLGIVNPTIVFVNEYKHSLEACKGLRDGFDSRSRSRYVGFLLGNPAAKEGGASTVRKRRFGGGTRPETRVPDFLQRAKLPGTKRLYIGCPPFLWKPMVLPWQKEHSEMPLYLLRLGTTAPATSIGSHLTFFFFNIQSNFIHFTVATEKN